MRSGTNDREWVPIICYSLKSPETPRLFKEIYSTELAPFARRPHILKRHRRKYFAAGCRFWSIAVGYLPLKDLFCAIALPPACLIVKPLARGIENLRLSLRMDGILTIITASDCLKKYGQVHPNQWQSQWILAEENAEVRRVLIQVIQLRTSHNSRIVSKTNR